MSLLNRKSKYELFTCLEMISYYWFISNRVFSKCRSFIVAYVRNFPFGAIFFLFEKVYIVTKWTYAIRSTKCRVNDLAMEWWPNYRALPFSHIFVTFQPPFNWPNGRSSSCVLFWTLYKVSYIFLNMVQYFLTWLYITIHISSILNTNIINYIHVYIEERNRYG